MLRWKEGGKDGEVSHCLLSGPAALRFLDYTMPNQICARLLKRISPYREREEEVQGSEETRGDLADRNGGHCWSLVDVCCRSKVVVVGALWRG